jgi:predicted lipoprotein with Yx(FWY)xxD motif
MEKTPRATARRFTAGRVTMAAFAIGGVATSTIAVAAANASTARTKSVVVSTVKNKKLGTILVSGGKSLYVLNKSVCTGKCLTIWPALLLPKGVTKATAGSGVSAAKLGTTKVAGGAMQVTYGGKAVFFFAEDKSSGQVNGNNVKDTWGTWSAIVTAKPSSTGSGGNTGGVTTTTTPGGGGTAF